MNEPQPEIDEAPLTQAELHAALFAQMVMQLASTAFVLLGRAPNPMTGKTETDLDAARLFIDQLEMLEVKTRGNLNPDEQHLLKQNLMTVRMAFVQTVEGGKSAAGGDQPAPKPADRSEPNAPKKFTKSYGAS